MSRLELTQRIKNNNSWSRYYFGTIDFKPNYREINSLRLDKGFYSCDIKRLTGYSLEQMARNDYFDFVFLDADEISLFFNMELFVKFLTRHLKTAGYSLKVRKIKDWKNESLIVYTLSNKKLNIKHESYLLDSFCMYIENDLHEIISKGATRWKI